MNKPNPELFRYQFENAMSDRFLDCPVNTLAQRALISARSLARMLRKLRRSMDRCRTCQARSGCPVLVDFNAQLTIALQEIADEWRLGAGE